MNPKHIAPAATAAQAAKAAHVAPDRIRARAYQIFEARCRRGSAGDAAADWKQAERELAAHATPTTPPPAPSTHPKAHAPRRTPGNGVR